MYLHLGQNIVVPEEEVIGIFDLDNTTGSHITRKFLSDAQRDGRIIAVTEELPKSFIVCSRQKAGSKLNVSSGTDTEKGRNVHGERNKNKVLLSQLSPQTLYNRANESRSRTYPDMTDCSKRSFEAYRDSERDRD